MIAKVNSSGSISHSLIYGQDYKKGGEIFLCQGIDLTSSPEEQARDWEVFSNDYRTRLYNIILSFDDNDTEKLRQIKDVNKRIDFEKQVIKAFIRELAERGNDITRHPFVVARHGNTDNEHFHISVLTTDFEGHRIRDKFIGKNAARAAAKVSREYGLHAAPKALEREIAHQAASGTLERPDGKAIRNRRSNTEDDIMDRLRRAKAVEEANKRKRSLKYVIEKVAKESDKDNFIANLGAENLTYCLLPKGHGVTTEIDGRTRSYTFEQLGVDAGSLPLPAMDNALGTKPSISGGITLPHTGKGETAHVPPVGNAAIKAVNGTGRLLRQSGGASGGQSESAEGSYSSDEDREEEWRREHGLSL